MSHKFKITKSSVQGMGLFTLQDLEEGEVVFDIVRDGKGQVNRDKYTIEVDGEHWMHNTGQFINHSYEPNLTFHKSGILFANAHIKAGEEVTFDYRESESEFSGEFRP